MWAKGDFSRLLSLPGTPGQKSLVRLRSTALTVVTAKHGHGCWRRQSHRECVYPLIPSDQEISQQNQGASSLSAGLSLGPPLPVAEGIPLQNMLTLLDSDVARRKVETIPYLRLCCNSYLGLNLLCDNRLLKVGRIGSWQSKLHWKVNKLWRPNYGMVALVNNISATLSQTPGQETKRQWHMVHKTNLKLIQWRYTA